MTGKTMLPQSLPLLMLAMSVALSATGGCQRSASPGKSGKPAAAAAVNPADGDSGGGSAKSTDSDKLGINGAADTHAGLHLKTEEVQKLGVVTEPVQATQHAPEATGFGVVVAHDAIAQSLAELRTAAAVAQQSNAAYERSRRLAGTPGAIPMDALEATERQATVDQAALDLAHQRLSSTYGQRAPWRGRDGLALLGALASGDVKLVRVTFPISALLDTDPTRIRLGPIGGGQTARTWDSAMLWSAPADSTIPGRSFFAIFKGHAFGEGERLLAWAPVAEPQDGVLLPAAAAVIAGGRYWCYLEEPDGTFVRTEFDPSVPVSGGYFVTHGADAGNKVVIKAAGQLLAKELNPSTEAE